MCDSVHTLILLLPFEGDGDVVAGDETGVVVGDDAAVEDESDGTKAEDVGTTTFVVLDLDVFTRAASEEEAADTELCGRALGLRGRQLG